MKAALPKWTNWKGKLPVWGFTPNQSASTWLKRSFWM
jgi:hypothetical protein